MSVFFSVIITTYNRAGHLKSLEQALKKQSFQNFEVIVVDDCSIDNTMEVLRGFDLPGFRFFSTAVNSGGPAIPRNMGLKLAKGEWIAFCDSDDLFKPDHLQVVHDFINRRKIRNGIISGNAHLLLDGKESNILYFPKLNEDIRAVSLLANWRSNHAIFSTLCIVNKEIVCFDEREGFRSIEDYIFLLENIIQGKKHYYIDQATIYYNSDSSDSIRKNFTSGSFLHVFKLMLFRKYRLWKRFDGGGLLILTFFSWGKSTLRRLKNKWQK